MADYNRNVIIIQQLLRVQQQQTEDEQAVIGLMQRRRRRQARRRRCWVRHWVGDVRRGQFGHYNQLMVELRREDPASFQNFLRIQPHMFDELLARVQSRITKQDINYRKALDPGTKLAATLRHLASGDTYASMKFDFRIPANTLSVLVKEVCQAIVDVYKDEVMQCPTTRDEWKAVADKFEQRWNVPHACGALDGKHVAIRKPPSSGSLFLKRPRYDLYVHYKVSEP